MRIQRTLGLVLALCLVMIAGAPEAAVQADQGGGIQSTLVNFDAAGHQAVRFDTQGNAVDAHEGQIALFGNTYYFYGTGYGCGFREYRDTAFCGVDVYSSTDLVHWVNRGTLFDATTDYWQSLCGHGQGCFRPHVVYNAGTGRYVLWISGQNIDGGYVVLDSTSPTGPFVVRPAPHLNVNNGIGFPQGDSSLFVDDDGTAYLIRTDWRRQGDVIIEQLDPTYESATTRFVRLQLTHNEAPVMFKRNGLYYVMTSDPNCAYCLGTGTGYLTAPSPMGPWSGNGPTPPPYWQVQDGTLLADGGGAGYSIQGADWTDYTFSFDTRPHQTTDGRYAQASWFFRARNESGPNATQIGGYVWSLSDGPSFGAARGTLVKTVVQNGQAATQTVSLPITITADTWYHVATTVAGATITTTVNGQVVDVTHDATYAQGRVGFTESSAAGEAAEFKNVSVTAPDGTSLLNDFSQFDPPLAPRQAFEISTDSCGGQPADVVAIPGTNGPLYLYLSDLWKSGDMPGLSNYYMGLLQFNDDGSIQPLVCQASVPLSLTVGSPGQQDTPPDLDQTSGYDGFQLACDITGSTMHLQTFTPSQTGTLTELSFATFSWFYGTTAPLALDIVTVDDNGRPLDTLAHMTVPSSGIEASAREAVVDPSISVVAGRRYGILIHSDTFVGCYGYAYDDANPYPNGSEYASTDGGATWTSEPARDLKFTVSVSRTAPATNNPPTATVTPSASATATASSTPTNTSTPTSTPTTTATDTPTPTPTNTALPSNADTPTATTIVSPAPTGTPPAMATRPVTITRPPLTATPRAYPARHPSLPLVVGVTPHSVASGDRLTVAVHTVAHARVTIDLHVLGAKTTCTRPKAKGPQRRTCVTHTIVLYTRGLQGTADSHGRLTRPLRVSYTVAEPVQASLTVKVFSARQAATRTLRITLRPRPLPLTVRVMPRDVTRGSWLGIAVRTAPRARITVALHLMGKKTTCKQTKIKGTHQRACGTRAVVLYTRDLHGTSDSRGRFTDRVRVAYAAPRPVQAALVITARTGRQMATRSTRVIINPLQHRGHT